MTPGLMRWGKQIRVQGGGRVIVAVKDDPTSPVCENEIARRVGKGRDKLAASLGEQELLES
jgi:hypothetical protein